MKTEREAIKIGKKHYSPNCELNGFDRANNSTGACHLAEIGLACAAPSVAPPVVVPPIVLPPTGGTSTGACGLAELVSLDAPTCGATIVVPPVVAPNSSPTA